MLTATRKLTAALMGFPGPGGPGGPGGPPRPGPGWDARRSPAASAAPGRFAACSASPVRCC
jgi:hypothetical protein